ncbi:MAG: Protein transport protein Sec16B, partial [Thelocarpon superellum]
MADGVYAGIGPAGERSWNPAWRPDNDRSTDASAPPPAASPSLPSQLDDRPITPPPGVQGGNENHPDLGNLREALNRSLSSPGGCEMEENPIHADHAEHDHLSTEDHAQPAPTKLTQVRSDFPAPRPSQDPPAPHGDPSTSASFARTISQGVSWGEDESTEPLPWDSRPAALDPRDFISDPHRTNSFPDVPELHQPADLVPSPEPSRSQAEPILKREEKNLESENRDWFGTQPGPEDDEWNQVLPSMPGGSAEGATTPFAPVNGSGGPEISDDQARYEEGLPLIAEGDARKTKQHEALPAKVNGITPAESYASDPHPLERKSTEQVLGGLYQSSSQENIESQASKSPSVNTTGGGIAVSRSTIISQVLSEKRLDALEIDSTPPESDAPAPGEDLAAMWKAALDDDDFLDEQEALDEPTNLFPGESAGFTPEVTNGPPGPMPVINQDGQIQGFSSLTVAGARTAISDSLQGRYTPQTVARPQSSSAYVPTMSLSSSLHSPPSLPGQQAVSYPWNAPSVRPLPNPETARAQSFADKSKGGYESPYDLPMDVSRPRKRASVQQLARGLEPRSVPLPMGMPPRSTSMYSSRSQDTYPLAPPSPQVGDMPSVASSLGPPASNPPREQSKSVGPGAMAPSLKAKPSSSNFFEDLPVTAKPRQSLATGRYATQPGAHASLPNPATGVMPLTFTDPTPRNVLPPGPPGFAGANLSTMEAEQLRAPERVSPYAPHPQSLHQLPPPSTTSRYSPAPPPQGGAQGPSRYAAPIMAQPHRPRTSSPLAYQQVSPKSSDPQPTYQAMHPAAQPVAHSYQPGPLDHQPAQLPSRATLPQSMGPNTSDYEPGPDSSTASAEPYAPRRSNAGLGASPLGPTVPLTSSPPKRVVSALSGLPPPAGPSSIPSTNTSPPRPQ